jgi:hypothetical protein
MKCLLLLPIALGLWPSAGRAADAMRLEDVLARARHELAGPRAGFEDSPLTELVQRAMISATGAEAALSGPLPTGSRIAPGPITVRDLLNLVPSDLRLSTTSMTGARIKELLEHSAARLAAYTFEDGRALLAEGEPDSLIDSFHGLSYEIDLTRPAGDRVIHLARSGKPLDPGDRVVVAVDERRLARGDLTATPDEPEAAWLKDALIAFARAHPDLDNNWDHDWSILPDYAVTLERPLIDRLVRHGAAPREEVLRLFPDQPARRGDMAYWLARAYGWRESHLSGAYSDVPDSLEPWLDGLLRRDVLGAVSTAEFFQPFAPIPLSQALDWCEGAARRGGLTLQGAEQVRAFRHGLLTGTGLGGAGESIPSDTLSRSQMLGLIANLRLPAIRVIEAVGGEGSALAAEVARLRAENPEGTLVFTGRDLTFLGRGLRISVRRGGAARGQAPGTELAIGRSRTPLQSVGAGELGVSDLVIDPVSGRVVENRERRIPIGAP